jgi:hypothetical protein
MDLADISRQLDDLDLLQAERSLYRVRHDLVARREECSQVPSTPSTPSRNWMSRMFTGDRGESWAEHANIRNCVR